MIASRIAHDCAFRRTAAQSASKASGSSRASWTRSAIIVGETRGSGASGVASSVTVGGETRRILDGCASGDGSSDSSSSSDSTMRLRFFTVTFASDGCSARGGGGAARASSVCGGAVRGGAARDGSVKSAAAACQSNDPDEKGRDTSPR